jgi:hypothetical protein
VQEQRHQEVSKSVGPSSLSGRGLKISGFSEARTLKQKSPLDTILSQKNSVHNFLTLD